MNKDKMMKMMKISFQPEEGAECKFKDWEIEDAVRTIIRAEEIKQDKELMAVVGPRIQKQVKATVNAAKILYGGCENMEDANES